MGVQDQPFAYQTGVFAWKYSKDKNERNSIEDSSVSQLPQKAAHKSSDLQAVLYGGSSLKPPGASSGGLRATSPGVASLVWSNLEAWAIRGPEDVLFTRSGTSAT